MTLREPNWTDQAKPKWPVTALRRLARLESGHTPSRQHEEYWRPAECTIPWFGLSDVWQLREGRQKVLGETSEKISALGMANSAARLLPAGTVVLSRTASVGFSGVMPIPMATTQDFANWVPGPSLSSDYLYWSFQAMAPEFERIRMGSTHKTIYMPDIKRLRIVHPPLGAQRAIADFLDRKTAAIDALIDKKERLLALLQEKRQALITQAVTKGLDPNVPMKDSGIEWLGGIPAHWEVAELRHHLHGIEQGWSPQCESQPASEDQWGVLKAGCVNGWRFRPEENKALPPDLEPRTRYAIRVGDLLMSRANTRELLGSTALVRELNQKLLLCDKVYRLRYKDTANAEFLEHLLSSSVARAQMEREATGASGSMQNIGQDTVKRLAFAWPPADEQARIATSLNERTSRDLCAQRKLLSSIERLREYRQALITAAVTGQLDVTEQDA